MFNDFMDARCGKRLAQVHKRLQQGALIRAAIYRGVGATVVHECGQHQRPEEKPRNQQHLWLPGFLFFGHDFFLPLRKNLYRIAIQPVFYKFSLLINSEEARTFQEKLEQHY